MKNLYKFVMIAASAAIALASCTQEVEQPIENEIATVSSHIEFTAEVADPATRATLTTEDEKSFKAAWEGTDKVSLYALSDTFEETAEATWNETDKCFEGNFTKTVPTVKEAWEYEAKYPYSADGNIPFGAQRVQKGNAYNSAYDIMYGTVGYNNAVLGKDDNNNTFVIPMTRLTGIAYFHITGGPDEDVVSATLEAEGIAATALTIDENGALDYATTADFVDAITITFEEGTAPKASDLQLWFNVLPGSYSGLKLTINTATKTAVLNSTKELTYTAGKLNKAVLSNLTWNEIIAGEPYVWTLASGDLGSTDSPLSTIIKGEPEISWNASFSPSSIYLGYNEEKGIQVGSGSKSCASLILTSKEYSGFIQSVRINFSHASSGGSSASVMVGNTQLLCGEVTTIEGTTVATDFVFSSTKLVSGPIAISFSNSAEKAFYVKSIEINPDTREQVVAPTFDPAEGEVAKNSKVSILCATEGATIYYTLDGSTPSSESSIYSTPIVIDEATTIKAIAVKEGMKDSDVTSAFYTIPAPSYVKVTSTLSDWTGQYLIVYEDDAQSVAFNGGLTTLDAVSNTIAVTISNDKILSNSTTDAAAFTIDATTDGYSIKSASGLYIGRTSDSNGMDISSTNVYLNSLAFEGTSVTIASSAGPVLKYNKTSGQERFRFFKTGQQAINLYKLEDSREDPGMSWSSEAASASWNTGNIASDFTAPTLSAGHATGITYQSTATTVATVSNTGAVTIIGPGVTTIKAIFTGDETYKGQTASYTLTVTDNRTSVATPVISPDASTTVAYGTEVTITCSTEGTTVYYTLDGSVPTTESTLYTSAIILTESTTVKAIAIKDGYKDSSIATATYTVGVINTSTEENPYSAADAVALAKQLAKNGTLANVYVRGIISAITTPFNSEYRNVSFNISADGLTTSTQFLVFRATATSENDYKVGDAVEFNGTLKNYNGTTPELDASATLIYQIHAPTISAPATSFTESVSVDITADNDATIYYSIDGGEPSLAYSAALTLTSTTTVKAKAVKDGVSTGIVSTTFTKNTGEVVLIIDGSKLSSSETTTVQTFTYDDLDIEFSDGAKSQSSTGDNRFSDKAILIGKSGKHIRNISAIPGKITKFEIYANKGASAKVSVGVNFSSSSLSAYNASASNTFTATLSELDHVYDCSNVLPEDAKYFWYQITNANNSQVEFRITYIPD